MISFLVGAATGVIGGIAVKDKLMPSGSNEGKLNEVINKLNGQNNALKSKCSELESILAQSKTEMEALKAKVRKFEDKGDDDEDAIADLKKANKRLIEANDSMASELTDVKSLLTLRNQEIDKLKNQIFDLTNK